MYRLLACLAALALVLPGSGAGPDTDEFEKARQELLTRINKVRAESKVAPLKLNDILQTLAQKHAENMARQEKLEHELDGKSVSARARDAKYPGVVGENVLMSRLRKGAVKDAVDGWLTSEGHRNNILSVNFIETGVGVARSRTGRTYFCQVFGLPGKVKTKNFAAIVNRTKDKLRVVWNKGEKPYELPAGQGLAAPFVLPKEGRVITLLPPDATGEPTEVTLHNGNIYLITQDGKRYKVEKMPGR
jgi:hypothetical protein